MAKEEDSLFRDISRGLHLTILWLFVVVASSLLGVDGCTSCGHGPTVRKQVNKLIHCDHKHHNNKKE